MDEQDGSLEALAQRLGDALRARSARMAAAESCTGGLIAGACTAVAGSSDWFERGFVTYSNAAKTELLGVSADAIVRDGAVSRTVAEAMARGARQHAPVQWSVAVTGIAGPGGAVPGKPVGTVWVAWDGPTGTVARLLQLDGDRRAVRRQTVEEALRGLLAAVEATDPR